MKKTSDLIFIIIICTFCLVFFFGGYLLPDKAFSENENRYLTAAPNFTFQDIFSGKYMRTAENYLNDQMPLRDEFISLRTGIQRLFGFQDVNGVYFGESGYLIEKHLEEDFDYEQLSQNTEAINQFALQYPNLKISVLIVPTSGLILEELLPKHAPMFSQKEVLDSLKQNLDAIQYTDLQNVLEAHDDSYIYFKTDHHWTALGAYFAYEEWCRQNGISSALSDYDVRTVSDSYRGSLYSKVLNADCVYDSIDLYTFQEASGFAYTVAYDFGKTSSDSCYQPKHLEQKDKYQVFLDGNHPEVTITTEQKNGKHLLVLKDSFANAFIPYLIPHYESIHIIDLRYFNRDVDSYMQENNVNEILILYNIINFASDKHFNKLIPD